MIRKSVLTQALLGCLTVSLSAEEPKEAAISATQQAPAAASEPRASKKRELGPWWEKNAMKLKPLPSGWLFHAEGMLSYMNASGNVSGSTLDAAVNGEVRKGRFTSHTFAQSSHRNIIYGLEMGSANYVEQTLREQLDFDPHDSITFFAVIENHRNTMVYLDKRLLVYGGMGRRVFRNEKSEVVVNGALGYADFTFDRAQLLRMSPERVGVLDTSPSSGGAIGMQTWRWAVSPRFNFSQDASYMKYFDTNLGDRWTVNLTGSFPIDNRFSFQLIYRLKEETNALFKAFGVFPQDRTFMMGVKVSI